MTMDIPSICKFQWVFILLVSCHLWEKASSQGYCGRYTCQRDRNIREAMLMKCVSDQPLKTHNQINETVPSVYDCIADLHMVDLKYGVTICSNVPQTHIMDVRPGYQATIELFQLYRLINAISQDSGNTNSKCYLKEIDPRLGIQPTRSTLDQTDQDMSSIPTGPILSPHEHYYSKNVLIGAIIGAFIAGLLVAIIVLLLIYFCCVRDGNEKERQLANPEVNRGYQHDSNANLSTVGLHGNQPKDWSREQREVMNRMDGMIDAYYGSPIDPYASIGRDPRSKRRETDDNISAMYSTIDVNKKNASRAQATADVDRDAFSFPNSSGAYCAIDEDSHSSDPQNTTSSTINAESNAESAEIVPPPNSFHHYHILEKSAES